MRMSQGHVSRKRKEKREKIIDNGWFVTLEDVDSLVVVLRELDELERALLDEGSSCLS